MGRLVCIVSFLVVTLVAQPSYAQDFLKQLEEKLSQKRQDEGNPPATDGLGRESDDTQILIPPPISLPSEQEPMAEPSEEELPLPFPRSSAPSQKPNGRNTTPPPPPPMIEQKPAPKSNPTRRDRPTDRKPAPNSSNNGIGNSGSTIAVPRNNGAAPGGGFLGMSVETIPGGGFGLIVDDVLPSSPAWKAGFRNGDRVIGIAGQAVSTVDAFAEQLGKFTPGSAVKFLVDRNGRNTSVVAVLQDRGLAGQLHGNVPGTAIELSSGTNGTLTNPINGFGYFGINASDMSDAFRKQFGIPVYRGASVTEVVRGSSAESAGLRPGDCIVELNGVVVRTANDLFDTIAKTAPGSPISVSYYRGRQLNSGSTTLGQTATAGSYSPIGVGGEVSPEMLTPEYVQSLQEELSRVQQELTSTQSRLQQMEARLKALERR